MRVLCPAIAEVGHPFETTWVVENNTCVLQKLAIKMGDTPGFLVSGNARRLTTNAHWSSSCVLSGLTVSQNIRMKERC